MIFRDLRSAGDALVYADWLDEQGLGRRAKMVRKPWQRERAIRHKHTRWHWQAADQVPPIFRRQSYSRSQRANRTNSQSRKRCYYSRHGIARDRSISRARWPEFENEYPDGRSLHQSQSNSRQPRHKSTSRSRSNSRTPIRLVIEAGGTDRAATFHVETQLHYASRDHFTPTTD